MLDVLVERGVYAQMHVKPLEGEAPLQPGQLLMANTVGEWWSLSFVRDVDKDGVALVVVFDDPALFGDDVMFSVMDVEDQGDILAMLNMPDSEKIQD